MVKRLRLITATIAGIAVFAVIAITAAAEEFYKGKTIRFVVATSPGGGFDTYTRAIARHIGKHIPGNPSTMVQNMPGAGHLIGANYMYKKAKPDGLTIGNWIGGLILQQVMKGRPGIQFDARKVEWVGVPVVDSPVCTFTKASGITSLDKWFAAGQPVKVGASAPGDTMSDHPRILRAALGLPMKIIEGYKGTAKIRLAAEVGEIAGGCWSWNSVKVTWRKAIESGEAIVVLQMNPKRHPDLPTVPNAIELVKSDKGRQWIEAGIHSPSNILRLYSLPPGTPRKRVKILQKAFMDTMRDPEFLAVANKSRLEISPTSGKEVKNIVTKLFKMDPAMIAGLRDLLVPKR